MRKQGDPLSPLLFNIAFDPLLRAILKNPRIHGFSFPPDPATGCFLPPVKILAYADDDTTLIALNNPTELAALEELLEKYISVSNAFLNYNKTAALFLSGNISCWHDKFSPGPLIYLGFGLFSNRQQ
ncbi:hypothetical protein G6F42_017982 [Rhizopus arrhizus]|nr:hypothetical protein G6F42_017982 [Rhizopus arrhizus]